MTLESTLKTMLLSLSASGLVLLGFAGSAQADALEETEGSFYCHSDGTSTSPHCALSTVCGAMQEHVSKPFSGDFDSYFDHRRFTDVTCEIMVYEQSVHYQCQDRWDRKHRGELVYSSYPKSTDAAAHYAVCKSLLSRYPTTDECGKKPSDPKCEKPEPEKPDCGNKPKHPGCKKPKKPDCGKKPKHPGCEKPKDPKCGDSKKPGCDPKPKKPDCGKKPKHPGCEKPKNPGCEKPENPGCEKPKNDTFRETCQSHHGRCTVVGHSRAGHGSHIPAESKFTVECQCNTGVNWGYSEKSPFFETVGRYQLDDVCEEEVRLCQWPLDGGQAELFGLEDHPQRKSSAQCMTMFGQCRVDADAAGNGHVNCQCFSGGASKVGMVYGMEPGVLGATEQCFVEVERCEIEKDHCPGGCGKGGVGDHGGHLDCSFSPKEERGPFGAMLALFAGIAGFRLRRRR